MNGGVMIPTIAIMIQMIGIMIGAYINTRMVGILVVKENGTLIKTFATITFILTIILCLWLVAVG